MTTKLLSPEVEPAVASPRRRELLGFFAGVAAAAPAALLLRRGQGATGRATPAKATEAARARSLDRRRRVAVVVPVAPLHGDTPMIDYDRSFLLGRALGEYLNHGSDVDLAPLAAVSLECLGDDEVDLPAAPKGGFWLLTEDAAVAYHLRQGKEAAIDSRIAALSDAFRRAVTAVAPRSRPLPERLREVASRCELGEPIPTFENHLDDAHSARPHLSPITPAEADHYAPQLLELAAGATGQPRRHLLAMLAERVRARLLKAAMPGAEWARASSCGVSYEERPEQSAAVLCGMGHVPERSRRFLFFYTQL